MSQRALGSALRPARRALLKAWPVAALLALAAACLWPILGTGYWAEDIYYSAMFPSGPILKDTTYLADSMESLKVSMLVGRFYPLTPVITSMAFLLFQDVVAYKAYILSVTLLDVALFYLLARRLTGRRGFALLASATAVALFQFRLTIDPFLAYYAQIQWVVAALLTSLICVLRYRASGRPAWLALAALGYLVCTLTYEMTYTLMLLPILLVAQGRPGWRRGLIEASPFVVASFGCAGMTVLIRWLHPSANYVHNTDFTPRLMAWSVACQVSSGLPLSYFLADPLALFGRDRGLAGWSGWVLQPGVIAVTLAAAALAFRGLRRGRRGPAVGGGPVGAPTLALLGLGLAVLPSVMTSISPFHRGYAGPGVGGIGVMIQYYGVALLIALGLWKLAATPGLGGPFARWKCLAGAALVAGILGVTHRANIEVAMAEIAPPGSDRYRDWAGMHGASWHLHRMNLVAAVDAGVMEDVPAGSRVQLANLYPFWHDQQWGQFFYTKQTRKRIETFPSAFPTKLGPDAPMFRVRDAVRDKRTGLVVVTPATINPFGMPPAADRPDQGRVFVRHPAFRGKDATLPTILLVGQVAAAPGSGGRATRAFRLGADLPVIRSGRGWATFALGRGGPVVDPDSLRIVADPVQVASWLHTAEAPVAAVAGRPEATERR